VVGVPSAEGYRTMHIDAGDAVDLLEREGMI
jgi:hypothetical protein